MADSELNGAQQRLYCDILEALGSANDVTAVMKEAYPLIGRLIPADYAAFGVCRSGRLPDYEWTVAELPASFFADYAQLAAHDFVRDSVVRVPNRALRDEEMIPRRRLEANPLYQRAREVGAPIEQVMAVMLHVDERWQGGLSLYRERRRPFADHERAALERLSPALATTLRRCQLFANARDQSLALELLLTQQRGAMLVATGAGRELQRSEGATALLERWFAGSERAPGALPSALCAALAERRRARSRALAQQPFRLEDRSAVLSVHFTELSRSGFERWLLRLYERPHKLPLPRAIAILLTAREREVTEGVEKGWDNRLIAEELGCALATVKRHLRSIFAKVGVETRAALQARIHELRRFET